MWDPWCYNDLEEFLVGAMVIWVFLCQIALRVRLIKGFYSYLPCITSIAPQFCKCSVCSICGYT